MREWPESRDILTLLARVSQRRLLQRVALGAAAGLFVAAVLVLVLLLSGVGVRLALLIGAAIALAGAVIAWARLDLSETATAALVEAHAPHSRNVIFTAAGLLKHAGPTPVEVCRVVMFDAARVARTLAPASLLPWSRPASRLTGAVLTFAAVFLVKTPAAAPFLASLTPEAASAPLISEVRITITPPSYTGIAPSTVVSPERLVAPVGSKVELSISTTGTRVSVETTEGAVSTTRHDDGRFAASLVVATDGFVAVTPRDDADASGPRRLIGVTATPDRPPVPRVTTPGKDLFLQEAMATLAIGVEATDDLGLQSLRLAYTKVAGVGESFTFTEGEVPLNVTRTSTRQWSATGTLPLNTLGLEVGDMVVYRAVATDARPGSGPVESDAFILEIVSTSEAIAEGFAIDDTKDKYAISQQMVILKTERLIAKAAGTPAPSPESVLEEALMIAAEQRSVRAELVFMTGGHFEDEFVEAAHEHEVSDGRFDNSGRADLGRAIRDMSRASAELTDGNLKPALEAEKAALEAMQRALSRRRFILRTLTQRESIDDSRRLTGTMSDLARLRRDVADPAVPARIIALRDGLAALARLAARPTFDRSDTDVVTGVTETLLKASPGDSATVDIISLLSKAGEAIAAGRTTDARAALADAATRMTTRLRTWAPMASPTDDSQHRRLRGALADAQRRGGGR